VHNSLNLWQANYALGIWAAKNIGTKAVSVSSFYESGYDAQHAFAEGFRSAAGRILYSGVANLPAEMGQRRDIISQIKNYNPDLVFASFSGNEAVDFVRNYKSDASLSNVTLLGSCFLTDRSLLPELGTAAEGILSCTSWNTHSNVSDEYGFFTVYEALTGKDPDSFAMLGYETALMIDRALQFSDGNLMRTEYIADKLSKTRLSGPRGMLVMNPDNHVFESPLSVNRVCSRDNIPVCSINEPVGTAGINKEVFAEIKTGWLNPYLCV
jgi:branched-chain amino acid transport system substrate-binding protein